MKKDKTFYALVCEESGIVGAFINKQEAKEYEQETELFFCSAKHKIVPCRIIILKK